MADSRCAELAVTLLPVRGRLVWPRFAPHHYLSASLNPTARSWLAVLDDGTPVGFTSWLNLPHAKLVNARRHHRTVVLPDYQGLGLGAALVDWLGQHATDVGHPFYSRTSHPRLLNHCEASPLWQRRGRAGMATALSASTTLAGKDPRRDYVTSGLTRVATSYRFVGPSSDVPRGTPGTPTPSRPPSRPREPA